MYDNSAYKFNYSEVLTVVNQNQRSKFIKLNEQIK